MVFETISLVQIFLKKSVLIQSIPIVNN